MEVDEGDVISVLVETEDSVWSSGRSFLVGADCESNGDVLVMESIFDGGYVFPLDEGSWEVKEEVDIEGAYEFLQGGTMIFSDSRERLNG